MLRPAILFKEPTADSSYENTLREKGYIAKCVPVLHTVHINIDGLTECLSNAKEVGIHGIIVTSKRSCESLGKAVTRLCSGFGISAAPEAALAYLSAIPFYVVGEATAAAVQEVQVRFKNNGFSCALVRGEQSGTGEQLGRFIIDHYDGNGMGKLLYLTGDKNRDTVPSILAENNIPFQALQVYETRQRSDFEVLLDQVVDSLYAEPTLEPWWTVFFAPSTAKFAMPSSRRCLSSRNISSRIATIGPVTTSAIEKAAGSVVQVTAPKPDALYLAEAIRTFDDEKQ